MLDFIQIKKTYILFTKKQEIKKIYCINILI